MEESQRTMTFAELPLGALFDFTMAALAFYPELRPGPWRKETTHRYYKDSPLAAKGKLWCDLPTSPEAVDVWQF